jgi:hypothetical protein
LDTDTGAGAYKITGGANGGSTGGEGSKQDVHSKEVDGFSVFGIAYTAKSLINSAAMEFLKAGSEAKRFFGVYGAVVATMAGVIDLLSSCSADAEIAIILSIMLIHWMIFITWFTVFAISLPILSGLLLGYLLSSITTNSLNWLKNKFC